MRPIDIALQLLKGIKDPDIDLKPEPSPNNFTIAQYNPPNLEWGGDSSSGGSGLQWTNPNISVYLPEVSRRKAFDFIGEDGDEEWTKDLARFISHEVGHQLTLDEKGFGDLQSYDYGYGGEGIPNWLNIREGFDPYTGRRRTPSGQAEKNRLNAIANAISSTNTVETPSYHMEYPESSYLANKLRIENQVLPQIAPRVRQSMSYGGYGQPRSASREFMSEALPKGVADQRRAYELVDDFGGSDATPAEKERAFRRIKGVMARQGSNIVNRPLKEIQQAIRREEAHDSKLRTARERGFDIPSLLSGKTSRGAGHLGSRRGYKMTGEPMDIAFQLLKAARNPEHKLAGGDYEPKNLKGYMNSKQAAKDLLGVHDVRISDHFVDRAVERGLLHPSKHRVKGHTQFDNTVIDHGKHFNPKGGWGGYGNPLDYFRDLAHVFVAQHGIMPHETVNLHMADRGNDVYTDRTHGGHRSTWGHSLVIAPDDLNPGHHALTTVLDETAEGKRMADSYSLFDNNGPHSGSMFNSPRRPSPLFRPQAPQAPQRQLNLHDITPEAKGYLNDHFQNPDNHHHGKPMFKFVQPRGQTGLEARWSGGKPPAGWNNTVGNHQQTIKDAIDGLHTQAELGMTTGAINDLHSSMNETMSQEYKNIGANYHDMNQGVEGFDPSMFLRGTPMDMAFQLLKRRVDFTVDNHPGESDPRHAAAEADWYIHGDDDTESLLDRMYVDQKKPINLQSADAESQGLAIRYANRGNRVYHPAVKDAHADEEMFPERMVHPESKEELVATNPRYGNSELHTMADALRFNLLVPGEDDRLDYLIDTDVADGPYDYAYVPMPTNKDIPFNEETGFTKSLLKERKSPEAFAHKLEYDKKYQKTPKRVKYREQLNTERRRRGIYGKGGKDVSHTQGGKLTLESPHSNRARHFKNRGTLRRVKVVKSEYKSCTACGKPGIISEHQPRCIYCHKRFY